MALLSSSSAGLLRPEEVGELLIQPLQDASVAMRIATVVTTTAPSFRLPKVVADPSSAWLAETDQITPSDATIDEIDCTPKALKTLTKLSNELVADSSPEATGVVGAGMARDIARKIDAAFFADTTSKGPSGLLSISPQTVDAGSVFDDLDPFEEAASKLEAVGAKVTAWAASADTCLTLSKLRQFTGTGSTSNVPLLSSDPTQPTRRQILGAPLFPLPDGVIADGVVWALDKSRVFVVLRADVSVEVDTSFYFDSDSTAVRSVIRLDFGFPHEEAVCQIVAGGS